MGHLSNILGEMTELDQEGGSMACTLLLTKSYLP